MDKDSAHLAKVIHKYAATAQTDLFLFNGPIESSGSEQFIDLVLDKPTRKPTASLFLTTNGGDPNAAYRMAKAIQNNYKRFVLLIVGPCKSAGTLIALGADELAFAPTGELGPLDVQIPKQDDILPISSGLDIFQALAIVTENVFDSFEDYFLQIVGKSGGNISARAAAEIASRLVTGLFQPIAAQIDPQRLGESQRSISIAKAYGERLGLRNLRSTALSNLIESYPSHPFVIDKGEAEKLFKQVRSLASAEVEIARPLKNLLRVIHPHAHSMDLCAVFKEKKDERNADTPPSRSRQNSGSNAAGNPRQKSRKAKATRRLESAASNAATRH